MKRNYRKLSIGYTFGAVCLAASMAAAFLGPKQPGEAVTPLVGVLLATAFVGLIGGSIYGLLSVYRLHKILLEVTAQKYPISAGKAVGFQFIPFYNIYWTFRWPREIADFVNHLHGEQKMARYKVGAILFASSVLGQLLNLGGLGIIIDFAVLGYLYRQIDAALDKNEAAAPGYDKPKFHGGAALRVVIAVLALAILGLLAAIAVPNFMAAKRNAEQNAAAAKAEPQSQITRSSGT